MIGERLGRLAVVSSHQIIVDGKNDVDGDVIIDVNFVDNSFDQAHLIDGSDDVGAQRQRSDPQSQFFRPGIFFQITQLHERVDEPVGGGHIDAAGSRDFALSQAGLLQAEKREYF